MNHYTNKWRDWKMYLKPLMSIPFMFFETSQTEEEVKHFLKTSFYVSCGSGSHTFLDHHIKMTQRNVLYLCRERSMQQSYEALCSKVTLLHSELKHQAGLIRKLRPLLNETRQGEAQTHTGTHTGTLWVVCDCDFVYLSRNPVVRLCPPFPMSAASCVPNFLTKSPQLCLWVQVSTLVFRFHTSRESLLITDQVWFIFENCTTLCLQNSLLHFYSSYSSHRKFNLGDGLVFLHCIFWHKVDGHLLTLMFM